MGNSPLVNVSVLKVSGNCSAVSNDILASEEPLEIRILYRKNNERIKKNVSVTMRTPGNDKELAIGFLFTEGIIKNRNQISDVSSDSSDENKITVTFNENEIPSLQNSERNFYTTSSCGVCGKASIDSIRTVSLFKNTTDNIDLSPDLFYSLPDILRKQQEIFESTGGLHASALFDLAGNLLILCEDVGRHNALDKVIGSAFMKDELPLNEKIVLLSGRASFELIQKAVMAGIKIVAAVGAPSGLAVKMAEEAGMTLIGFLRDKRLNIYSGNERINLKDD